MHVASSSETKWSRPSSPTAIGLPGAASIIYKHQDMHSLDGVGNEGYDGDRNSHRVCPCFPFLQVFAFGDVEAVDAERNYGAIFKELD